MTLLKSLHVFVQTQETLEQTCTLTSTNNSNRAKRDGRSKNVRL